MKRYIANIITSCRILFSIFMLFVLPFTLLYIELKYSAVLVCTLATFAAIQEGHYIRTGIEV